MPPATPIAAIHSAHLDKWTTLTDSKSGLFHRQGRRLGTTLTEDEQTIAIDTTVVDTTSDSYTPYSPPPSLHAPVTAGPIVPEQETPQPTSSPLTHSSHLKTPTIIAIVLPLVIVSLLCGLGFTMFMRFKFGKTMSGVRALFRRGFRKRHAGKAITKTIHIEEETVIYIGPAHDNDENIRDSSDLHQRKYIDSFSDLKLPEIRMAFLESPTRTSLSFISRDSLAIRADGSAPTVTGFQERVDAEEADITLAVGIALRDYTYSEPESSSIEEESPKRPIGHQYHNCLDVVNTAGQGSDASHSTQPTAESDEFSIIAATTRSSLTSFIEIERNNGYEDMDFGGFSDEDIDTNEVVFEVARAQTQSLEIKKGILVNWCTQRGSLSSVLERSGPSRLSSPYFRRSTQLVGVPSLVVTCPSTMTLPIIGPSFSSISVDLNEFPLPPCDFDCGAFGTLDTCFLEVPEI